VLAYLRRRVVLSIPVIFGLATLVFFLMHLLPGDAVTVMLTSYGASGEEQAQLRHTLGLDRPVFIQYLDYMGNAVRGDFGRSLFSHQPVNEQILQQLPATLQLTVASMLFAILAGILIGVFAAVRHNSPLDRLSMFISLLGVSMPGFWLGIMLILLFSLTLGWLPASGTGSAQQLILPALALSFNSIAVMARLVRGSMLEILRQDYVATARAKGLPPRDVIGRHALSNALIPVVTFIGIQFGGLLGGAIIIETVFGRQGIGQLAVGAIQKRDMPLVEGTVIFVGIVTVLANLAVDLLYAAIDPRVRIDA
jgi:peptide/nickel transport system permease protein